MKAIMKKLRNQKGQSAIEYALIAVVLLAIIVAAVQTPLQNALTNLFGQVEDGAGNIGGTTTTTTT